MRKYDIALLILIARPSKFGDILASLSDQVHRTRLQRKYIYSKPGDVYFSLTWTLANEHGCDRDYAEDRTPLCSATKVPTKMHRIRQEILWAARGKGPTGKGPPLDWCLQRPKSDPKKHPHIADRTCCLRSWTHLSEGSKGALDLSPEYHVGRPVQWKAIMCRLSYGR